MRVHNSGNVDCGDGDGYCDGGGDADEGDDDGDEDADGFSNHLQVQWSSTLQTTHFGSLGTRPLIWHDLSKLDGEWAIHPTAHETQARMGQFKF